MNYSRIHCCVVTWSGLVIFAIAGCGTPSPATVSGKIVPPPNAKVVETDSITIDFIAEDPKGKSAATSVNDLAFTTKELVPGKYKVTVQVTPYAGLPESEKRTRAFEPLNNNFNRTQTKLLLEVTRDPQQSVVIDLGKGTISKN